MKQHILPKQAQEITEEQFYSLFNNQHYGSVRREDWAHFHHKKVTVGKCIEILFEHKVFREYTCDGDKILNCGYGAGWIGLDWINRGETELIDALWEAVKSILQGVE